MNPALRGSRRCLSVAAIGLLAAVAACGGDDSPPQTASTAVEGYLSAFASADTDTMRALQCAHPFAKNPDDDFARNFPEHVQEWKGEAWWPPDWGLVTSRSLTETVHEVEWWMAADEQSREQGFFFVFKEGNSWRICAYSDTAANPEFQPRHRQSL